MSEDSLPADPAPRKRRRAPSMTPEARRAQLIEVAIPLIGQHGGAVTTAQVAGAAGVAEGTIFRLFPDKHSLVDAALAQALDPSETLERARSFTLETPVRERMERTADAVRAHFRVALPVMHGAMRHGQSARAAMSVGNMFIGLLGMAEDVFVEEVEAGRVHGQPAKLARVLVGLCQSVAWQDFFDSGQNPIGTDDFITVLLAGFLTDDAC
jgi:AcrR family transcriptional regulator